MRGIGFGRGNPKYITRALYLCTQSSSRMVRVFSLPFSFTSLSCILCLHHHNLSLSLSFFFIHSFVFSLSFIFSFYISHSFYLLPPLLSLPHSFSLLLSLSRSISLFVTPEFPPAPPVPLALELLPRQNREPQAPHA